MGRVLKRVPLDFKWPMKMVWKGYINPYKSVRCKACDGSGLSEKAMEYKKNWYCIDSFNWIPNPYCASRTYCPDSRMYNLTQVEVDALVKNNRIPKLFRDGCHPNPDDIREFILRDYMGLDCISMYICMCATAESEGWDTDCSFCGGTGEYWFSDEVRNAHENWESQDPPTGDGYQLWTTTNEGAPVSPVFGSMEELAEWCVDGATIFGKNKLTYKQWMKMFTKDNFVYEFLPGTEIV